MSENFKYITAMVGLVLIVALFSSTGLQADMTGNAIALRNADKFDDDSYQQLQNGVTHNGVFYENFCLAEKYPGFEDMASREVLRVFKIQDGRVKGSWTNCAQTNQECIDAKCVGLNDPAIDIEQKNTRPYNYRTQPYSQ